MIEVNLMKLKGSCIDNPAIILSDLVMKKRPLRIFLLEEQEDDVMKILHLFNYRVTFRGKKGSAVIIEAVPRDA